MTCTKQIFPTPTEYRKVYADPLIMKQGRVAALVSVFCFNHDAITPAKSPLFTI